jgi:myo-inositol catabolism protein IolC
LLGEQAFHMGRPISLSHPRPLKVNNRSLQVGYIVGQLLTDPAEQRLNDDTAP